MDQEVEVTMKYTKCGCDCCEYKAKRLFTWIEKVLKEYPHYDVKNKICSNSKKIPDVPLQTDHLG